MRVNYTFCSKISIFLIIIIVCILNYFMPKIFLYFFPFIYYMFVNLYGKYCHHIQLNRTIAICFHLQILIWCLIVDSIIQIIHIYISKVFNCYCFPLISWITYRKKKIGWCGIVRNISYKMISACEVILILIKPKQYINLS